MPRLQLRARQHGARLRRASLPLRLVAAGGRQGGRHGGSAWTRRPPPLTAAALRHPVRPGRRRPRWLDRYIHRRRVLVAAHGAWRLICTPESVYLQVCTSIEINTVVCNIFLCYIYIYIYVLLATFGNI